MDKPKRQLKSSDWFGELSLSWTKAVTIAIIGCVAWFSFLVSRAGWSFEQHFVTRSLFSLRQWLEIYPDIDPRLKVLVYDDQALNRFEAEDLDPAQWANLIEAIQAANPGSIIFDKRFGGRIDQQSQLNRLNRAFQKTRNAVVAGIAVTPPSNSSSNSARYVDPTLNLFAPSAFLRRLPPNNPPSIMKVLGPHDSLLNSISGVGHINNDSYGYYRPYYRLEGGGAILHLALQPFKDIQFRDGEIYASGHLIDIARNGTIIPNFLSTQQLVQSGQVESLANYLSKKESLSFQIKEGDYVLIVLKFYSNGTDFKDTPAGTLLGGFMIASMLNDVLTGKGIRHIDAGLWTIIAGCLFAVPVIVMLDGFALALALGALIASALTIWVYAFCWEHTILPILWSLGPFATTACIGVAEKLRVGARKNRILRMSLSDKLSPFHLQKLTGNPPNVDSHAYQREITLMFIDVVGYSKYAEQEDPEAVFANLRALIGQITLLIYEHNGSVNNTFGDGVLAIFGYHFDGKTSSSDHADDALRCAIAIQKAMVLRNFDASQNNRSVHPLRIGINTGLVCIGDLADDDRFNFTVIGHAVNYAKRLEEACEFYRIMFGTNTMSKLRHISANDRAISKRLVLIKHRDEPLEAFEYDPLVDDPELSSIVHKQYWRFAGLSQREDRISVPGDVSIQIQSNYGDGRLANFSRDGLAFNLKSYLANGMVVEFSMDSADGKLGEALTRANLQNLTGEVRWGTKLSNGYQHGIMLKNVTDAQKEYLFECISEMVLSSANPWLANSRLPGAS
jgi:class 3 adenylate cyclase/CHASE2 domain-containing sensor protein